MSTRADKLAELLADEKLDLILVTDLVNVRYLTGYTGSNGLALIGPDTRRFITDFRYVEQAAAEVDPAFERLQEPQELLEAVAGALPKGDLRLGFEDANLSVRQHEMAALGDARGGVADSRRIARRAAARGQGSPGDRDDQEGHGDRR